MSRKSDSLRGSKPTSISRHQLEVMLDTLADGVMVFDPSGRVVLANSSEARLFGLESPTELMRDVEYFHSLFELRDTEGTPVPLEQWPVSRVQSGESFSGVVLQVSRRDTGKSWIVSFSGRPIPAPESGQPLALVVSSDVTAQQAARETSEHRLAQLHAVVNQMTEGLVIFDPAGNLLEMNPAALAIHRLDSSHPPQWHINDLRKIFELFDLEGRPLPVEEWPVSRVLRGEVISSYEVTVRLVKTGETWVASYGGAPVRDREGNLILSIVTLREVTQQKQAEASLRESRELLDIFIERAPAALAMFDRQMRYLNASRRWRADFGLADRDLVGMSHYELFPEVPERWKEAHRRGMAGAKSRAEADRFDRANGTVQWLRWEIHPWYTSNGEVGGILIFSEDITGQKRAEEELRELTQRLTYHMENSPLAVLEFDEELRITRWCGTAEKVFGWRACEVLGKHLEDMGLVYEEDAERTFAAFSDLRAGRSTRQVSENRNCHKDGSILHCEWHNSALFDQSGRLASILSLAQDVTDRRKLEEALQQYSVTLETKVAERTTELREKDRLLIHQSRQAAMGDMINNIAHQWRQPLNNLGLMVQELKFRYELGPFDKEYLDSMVAKSMQVISHMSQTIDDFRNFFRQDREPARFEINEVVLKTIALLEASFKSQQITILVHEQDKVSTDGISGEFSQVIINLLINAREALVERETPAPRIVVTIAREKAAPLVTVSDNAGGIPEEIIARIFEPYFSTKGPQGTGIGLFMSKTIIENKMGGRLTVRNGSEGAEFRIEL